MADDRDRYDRWTREERWRGADTWGNERSYSSDRPYGDRGYLGERAREEYREYGDRYGREYSNPRDRDYVSPRDYAGPRDRDYSIARDRDVPPSYARGSQEFGPEGYGAPSRDSRARTAGREWTSSERWRVPGPFAGRGPRGYKRSDERIKEEICDRLTAHGLLDASDVEVQAQNGEATLTGYVDSREAKRAAEDCVEDVVGVREVHNHLRIRSHSEDAGVGRTSVLGLTEHETQDASAARQAEAAGRSRARNT
jgi:hypothetical protein